MNRRQDWQRYRQNRCVRNELGLELDISRMDFPDSLLDDMTPDIRRALEAMTALERGAIANADENRMVGHYWLRDPALAPHADIRRSIEQAITDVQSFAGEILSGSLRPPKGDGFFVVLLIGIGGSALGPQLLCDALGGPDDAVIMRFLDNTDPQGIERTLAELGESLHETLVVVVSKSGGTKETRNGMIETARAFETAGLSFPRQAVAITQDGSQLHQQAVSEGWLRTFPLWDWVGGRTSITSPVGLLPAALIGADVDEFLRGAREMDAATREADIRRNPAALLSLMWHHAGGGTGKRNMVVLPYRDRLALLGRYLQQLVMESLGKAVDRQGRTVHQGLTVYGNKGSTDQHAFVQQLREGPDDFFVTFIRTLSDDTTNTQPVEPDITSGDYLDAFWQGTRAALRETNRQSITLTLETIDPRRIGALIALFERTVGLYAELIDVNAYHQPGVEAGKKAADAVLDLQRKGLAHLRAAGTTGATVEEIAAAIGEPDGVEDVYHLLTRLAASGAHGLTRSADTAPEVVRFVKRS